ncbi:MAG: hypothetical protein IE937_03690 [Gammaproteobacteria bacterium]|nr:hypothetical protein [Gammaproteobacteria bacterium]MBD3776640.1 hypothetical protein [Thiotrichales bacterium]
MQKSKWLQLCCLSAVLAVPMAGQADDEAPIYGRQLMTQQELQEHQAKMRAAQTNEERERIRAEQHEMIQERAKQKGVAMPEEVPERGHMHQQEKEFRGKGIGGGVGGGHGYGHQKGN